VTSGDSLDRSVTRKSFLKRKGLFIKKEDEVAEKVRRPAQPRQKKTRPTSGARGRGANGGKAGRVRGDEKKRIGMKVKKRQCKGNGKS